MFAAHTNHDTLESLMHAAWPAVETAMFDGWVLRSAGGVTQRANSIWPVSESADPAASLRRAENWYAERRQPVIFQLTRRPKNAALEALLDMRGYSRQSETLIMTGDSAAAQSPLLDGLTLSVAHEPSGEWLDLWWSVDGRGGVAEKLVAQRILTKVPSLYASARNAAGDLVGTGRITLVDGWGGVYCMATHPDFRRRGVALAVLQRLSHEAHTSGTSRLWLLVTAANKGARDLYAAAGFTEEAGYHYRQAPLRRAPGAC